MKQKRSYMRDDLIDVVYDIVKNNFKHGLILFDKYAIISIFKSASRSIHFSDGDLKQVTRSTGELSVLNDIKWCIKILYEEGYLDRKRYHNSNSWIYFIKNEKVSA